MDALVLAARELAERPGGSPVRLLDPPLCSGPWRGQRIDVPILAARVAAARRGGAWAVVLTDIPDDDASLSDALARDHVLGALAVGCGTLDVWVDEDVADGAVAQGLRVRRGGGSPIARVVVAEPAELRALWAWLEERSRPGSREA